MQIRHALLAADAGHVDLQAYEEHSRDSASAWHTKLKAQSATGIEVDDALEISEQSEI
jgi:hypothetical protein